MEQVQGICWQMETIIVTLMLVLNITVRVATAIQTPIVLDDLHCLGTQRLPREHDNQIHTVPSKVTDL